MSEREYNKTLIPVYRTKNGGFISMKVDAYTYDKWQQAQAAFAMGAKIIVKELSEDARSKFKNPDTAPHAFIEIMSPDSVADYEAKNPRKRNDDVI